MFKKKEMVKKIHSDENKNRQTISVYFKQTCKRVFILELIDSFLHT